MKELYLSYSMYVLFHFCLYPLFICKTEDLCSKINLINVLFSVCSSDWLCIRDLFILFIESMLKSFLCCVDI